MGRKKKLVEIEGVKEEKYILSNEEFQPLLKQIYEKNMMALENQEEHLPINVEPHKIICLRRLKGGGKKIAYIKKISNEYQLLTEAKYFMVICNDQYNMIQDNKKKAWVILHEYCHCWWNTEKQKYETIDHDICDFTFLIKDPEANLELVEDFVYVPKDYTQDNGVK